MYILISANWIYLAIECIQPSKCYVVSSSSSSNYRAQLTGTGLIRRQLSITCTIVSDVVVVKVDVDIEAYCLSPQNHDTIRYDTKKDEHSQHNRKTRHLS